MVEFPDVAAHISRLFGDGWLKRVKNHSLLISEGTFELGISLMIMIMVERSLGEAGLGVFSYFYSFLVFTSFISDFGIARSLEHDISVTPGTQAKAIEKAAAYIIIALVIPVRNWNRLKIAVLQGTGRFDRVTALKNRKRILLLVSVFLLLKINVAPSYLLAGYLISEVGLLIKSRREAALSGLMTLWRGKSAFVTTIRRSRHFMFTDEAIDVVFYMDFLIHCTLSGKNRLGDAATAAKITTTLFFFCHGLLGLYVLLYFPTIIDSLYLDQGKSLVPCHIFAALLPGLLFFSSMSALEAILEASENITSLQKSVVITGVLNFFLNCFFVPFAGFYGAAFSSACAMLAYFILINRELTPLFRIETLKFFVGGAAVYLAYILFENLDVPFLIALFLVPVVLATLFYISNLFYAAPVHGASMARSDQPQHC